uniref:Glutamyl-tRNA reductase n=1 Tax=Candidatus Kentrum sp. MB TaxID=2138164 RepID=A0A450XMV7_9GAMM|nr:MAG: glutamyl-tRNA reductase [Candidatus Kentron sp. MB]VFK30579.1 MAG: glutamyl-tRNA reductase [Candidatus Kentron sp. MB]VFK75309.1 MAG: glutamyl-tRNA reductase [Candidatus Kentron sp. MB]
MPNLASSSRESLVRPEKKWIFHIESRRKLPYNDNAMPILAFGINHNTASAAVRERAIFAPEEVPSALHNLIACHDVQEAAILCTCNRTDLYCDLGQGNGGDALDWFRRTHGLTVEETRRHLYTHWARQAVRHIMRVASGLDSMIMGEPQILGQFKDAYSTACQCGTIGHILGRLFQYTFSTAKHVRTDTAIGASPVSVAFAAVTLARQILGEPAPLTALFIGAGETMELVGRHLVGMGLQRLIIANRTLENAHRLAGKFNGYAITLQEIPRHLSEVDMVFSATASQELVLTLAQVVSALEKRKRRPIYMVDMAIPRDIDSAVGELEDIYLYTVDDLRDVIQENLRSRQDAARQAEKIIDIQVDRFMGWLGTLDVVPTIRAFRGQGDVAREQVLHKAKRMLAAGAPPEETLDFLATTLTNKLLHQPTAQLRRAGFDGRSELINAARMLFELSNPDSSQEGR